MSLFADAADLEAELLPALRKFLSSPVGRAAGEQAAASESSGSLVALNVSEPSCEVWVDLEALEVGSGPRGDAAATLYIDADSLHHLGMNQLEPAQVTRALEERRLNATGSFELMLGLLESLDQLGQDWRQTLREHGRTGLIEAAAPEPTPIYLIEEEKARIGSVPEWVSPDRVKRAVSVSTRRD